MQQANEALRPYKEAHARLDALEFRLVTVALLAKNVTLKQLEDKKEELLSNFFAVEDDHEMAYTSEEKRRIAAYMQSKMDEVEPAAFDASLTSEATMIRVMSQVGGASTASEIRSLIEAADSDVNSCGAELTRLASSGATFSILDSEVAVAAADFGRHLSGILLVPTFTAKALSDVLHDDRVLGVTREFDSFRSYPLRLWGAASVDEFDTDTIDRYVVLQQQLGGGDRVADVGVVCFDSVDAVSDIMKQIVEDYEEAAGLFRIASMLPPSYIGQHAVLAWTAIGALRAARVEKVLLTQEEVDAIETDVLSKFGDDAEVTDSTLFLGVWLRNAAMTHAYERYAGFDGVCEPNPLGFGLVLLGNVSVARRLDLTDMDEDSIKGKVVALAVEIRREHKTITRKVGEWIAKLEDIKARDSYLAIVDYRSDVLSSPYFANTKSTFDNVLATVFPGFVLPLDDTPHARAESYVRSSFVAAAAATAAAAASAAAAAASSDDIDRKIRLTLAGIECLRSLGVFVLVGYETDEELVAMKNATKHSDCVIAKLVMSEMTLRQWNTAAVDPVLAAGDFVGGFGVTVYRDKEGESLWTPPLQTFSYSHEEDEEQLHVELTEALSLYLARCTSLAEAAAASRVERREAAEAAEAAERRQIGRVLQEAALVGASVGAAIEAAGEAEQEPPADFVLLPRDLPWERVYDLEDADMPQIAKLRLTLPTDYPTGTVLKLPMPCLCGEHTSRFTKKKAGTSIIIKWDLRICGLVQEAGVEVEAEAERVAAEAEAARHADELLAEIETEKEAAAAKAKKKKKKKKKKGGESRQSVAELAVALEGGATLEAEPVVELEAEQAPASVAVQATHAPAAISLADVDFDTGRPAPESTLGGETTCIVCFSRPKSHACVPCGHLSACEACSERMRHCPVCRAEAVMWMRIVAC